jgi:hypothetical protein
MRKAGANGFTALTRDSVALRGTAGDPTGVLTTSVSTYSRLEHTNQLSPDIALPVAAGTDGAADAVALEPTESSGCVLTFPLVWERASVFLAIRGLSGVSSVIVSAAPGSSGVGFKKLLPVTGSPVRSYQNSSTLNPATGLADRCSTSILVTTMRLPRSTVVTGFVEPIWASPTNGAFTAGAGAEFTGDSAGGGSFLRLLKLTSAPRIPNPMTTMATAAYTKRRGLFVSPPVRLT